MKIMYVLNCCVVDIYYGYKNFNNIVHMFGSESRLASVMNESPLQNV